jgi:hypothetical protein
MNMKDCLTPGKIRRAINDLTVLTWVAPRTDALCLVIVTHHKVPEIIHHGGDCPGNILLSSATASLMPTSLLRIFHSSSVYHVHNVPEEDRALLQNRGGFH